MAQVLYKNYLSLKLFYIKKHAKLMITDLNLFESSYH